MVVVDPHTVAFELKKPFAPLLAALAERPGFIVSPTAVKQLGQDFGNRPVGTGPFKLVEWVRDSQVTLERFPDYWEKGKPHVDRVIYRVVPDPTVRLTMVRTGEVDIATDVDAKDIPERAQRGEPQGVRDEARRALDRAPVARGRAARSTTRRSDRRLRWRSTGTRSGTCCSEASASRPGGRSAPASGGRTRASGAYSSTSRWPGRSSPRPAIPTGSGRSSWSRTPRSGSGRRSSCRRSCRRSTSALDIEPVNPADAYSRIVQRKTNWTHTRWAQRADPNGLLYILFHSKGQANTTGYNNPKVDELLDQAAGLYEVERRRGLYYPRSG